VSICGMIYAYLEPLLAPKVLVNMSGGKD